MVRVARNNPVNLAGRRLVLDVGTGFKTVEAYQWFRQGALLTGATNALLILDPLAPSGAGDYEVQLTSGGQTRLSDAARVTVLPEPTPGRILAWGDNTWGQLGFPAELCDAIKVSACGRSSFALRDDGS